MPSHVSAVQGSPSSVQAVPLGLKPSVGHVVLVPVQVSAASHSFTAARQTEPAFPAGCVQAGELTLPLHTSVLHTFPSSVQAVPDALTAFV